MSEVYKSSENVVLRKIADEYVLMPILDSLVSEPKIFGLNKLGHFIWSRLDGKNSLEDVLQEILNKFDTTSDAARIDLNTFITSLLQQNLISKVE